jgi:hypothetical protein
VAFQSEEWLASLKPGDEVFVFSTGGSSYIAKVERLTSTQVMVGGRRFNRKSGRSVGSTAWHHAYLQELTPELRRRREIAERRTTLRYADWQNLPDTTIDALYEVYQRERAK